MTCRNPIDAYGAPAACGGEERICAEGRRYVERRLEGALQKAVLCCEGACVKGEIARVAANLLAYEMRRGEAVRICLGDAATADSGMIDLLRRASETIAIEGCGLCCCSEILKKFRPDVTPTRVVVSPFYEFDKERQFEIFDMPREEIERHARIVAAQVAERHFERS